jgi:hypothetical protein
MGSRRIAAVDPALCNPSVTHSRVGTHWSEAQYLRDTLFKGRNIQELLVGDTSVGDTSTLHLYHSGRDVTTRDVVFRDIKTTTVPQMRDVHIRDKTIKDCILLGSPFTVGTYSSRIVSCLHPHRVHKYLE